MQVTVKMEGAAEIERALRELGPQIANRLGVRALRKAARVFIKEMRRLVPRRTRALSKSIVAVRGRDEPGGRKVFRIAFKRPASRYAHLVEFGTRHSAAKPFIRPAMDSQAQAAVDAMAFDLSKGIAQQEYKKLVNSDVDLEQALEFED